MFSRTFARIVLVAIIAVMVWTLHWTWMTVGFQNLAQRIVLTIVESSVLLAGLSLLIESFLSFASLDVRRGSWIYTLFGFWLIDLDENTNEKLPSAQVRTCALFGVISFVLSILSLYIAAILTILFQVGKTIVLFMFNPYMPSVDWLEVGTYSGVLVAGVIGCLLIIQGFLWLEKKLVGASLVVKRVVFILAGSVFFGLAMAIINIFSPIGTSPFYLVFFVAVSFCLILAVFVGTIFVTGYGLYKLIGSLSQKNPVLKSVWNQVCPVRTVNFLDD